MGMPRYYILREQNNAFHYDNLFLLQNPSSLKLVENETRLKILKLLAQGPLYPAELAKRLHLHEQNIYYHIKQLQNAGILELTEKKEIRGTTAKKYAPKELNFAVSLAPQWKQLDQLVSQERDRKLQQFLTPFIENSEFRAKIVVGSPDPHGPFKARARDGHYAIDLAVYLGRFCSSLNSFSVQLDVDVNLKNDPGNYILVGGPVTNLIMQRINDFLPAKFSDKRPWGIVSRDTYTDDSIGIIAKIPNPYHPDNKILALAGVRFSGTKATVIALTRFTKLVLNRFTGQKEFYCIVQGFDMDGDGKIDSVEVLE
jgi:DNA-binding transcriptional ArsR family regulator